jgi:integrase
MLGRRDNAVIMIPSRLGLRANVVATLTLDDIGWRSGTMLIRAKGRQQVRLPMPPAVGAAIVAYLRQVIGRIAEPPVNRVADLRPWNIMLPAVADNDSAA